MILPFTIDRCGTQSDDFPNASTLDQMRKVQSETDQARDVVFAKPVDRHERMVYKVAFSLFRNTQGAEDAVQAALLKLYRGDAWKRMRDEKAFLARTVWRIALDRLPQTRKLRLEERHEQICDLHSSSEIGAIRNSETKQLRKWIDGLPEDLRQVLLLSAIEELNARDRAPDRMRRVADHLSVPNPTQWHLPKLAALANHRLSRRRTVAHVPGLRYRQSSFPRPLPRLDSITMPLVAPVLTPDSCGLEHDHLHPC